MRPPDRSVAQIALQRDCTENRLLTRCKSLSSAVAHPRSAKIYLEKSISSMLPFVNYNLCAMTLLLICCRCSDADDFGPTVS